MPPSDLQPDPEGAAVLGAQAGSEGRAGLAFEAGAKAIDESRAASSGDARVELGSEPRVHPGAFVLGPLRAGDRFSVFPTAVVGGPAQHRSAHPGALHIGHDVVVREGATVHRGSSAGAGITSLGDRVLVMAYAHIGHDCQIEHDVVLSNGTQLGGHVQVGAWTVFGARCAVHQHVRVGVGAMVVAGALVTGDVPPFTMVSGDRARVVGVNSAGLRAFGLSSSVDALRRGLRQHYAGVGIDGGEDDPAVRALVAFVRSVERRPLCSRGRG